MVECDDQAEVDRCWEALGAGGTPLACGWITDRFGVTWQITPSLLLALISDPDPGVAGRVMRAMMQMVKIEIGPLLAARDGRE